MWLCNIGWRWDWKNKNTYKLIELQAIGMVNLTCPDRVKLLDYPRIWIGDMAATVHMNPMNLEWCWIEVTNWGTVHDGGKWKAGVRSIHGSIKGQMINKKGMEVGSSILTDVGYSPSMKFNLFSLSRLIKNRWICRRTAKAWCLTLLSEQQLG